MRNHAPFGLQRSSALSRVEVEGRKLGRGTTRDLTEAVRRLNLDEDLSEFYALVAADPDLCGRLRERAGCFWTPTAFEAAVIRIFGLPPERRSCRPLH